MGGVFIALILILFMLFSRLDKRGEAIQRNMDADIAEEDYNAWARKFIDDEMEANFSHEMLSKDFISKVEEEMAKELGDNLPVEYKGEHKDIILLYLLVKNGKISDWYSSIGITLVPTKYGVYNRSVWDSRMRFLWWIDRELEAYGNVEPLIAMRRSDYTYSYAEDVEKYSWATFRYRPCANRFCNKLPKEKWIKRRANMSRTSKDGQ